MRIASTAKREFSGPCTDRADSPEAPDEKPYEQETKTT
jgi:hypothetical protein